jgi:hypothetical protein
MPPDSSISPIAGAVGLAELGAVRAANDMFWRLPPDSGRVNRSQPVWKSDSAAPSA